MCFVTSSQKTSSSRVTSHDLPRQGFGPALVIQPALVGSKFPSALKSTIHKTFSFWFHTNKIHTEINQLAVTAKILSQPGIQLCGSCSCSIVANRFSWAAQNTSLACSTFRSHLNTDHICDLPEIRKIFRVHYSTENQSPWQQMC
jgi:hypothetical protein